MIFSFLACLLIVRFITCTCSKFQLLSNQANIARNQVSSRDFGITLVRLGGSSTLDFSLSTFLLFTHHTTKLPGSEPLQASPYNTVVNLSRRVSINGSEPFTGEPLSRKWTQLLRFSLSIAYFPSSNKIHSLVASRPRAGARYLGPAAASHSLSPSETRRQWVCCLPTLQNRPFVLNPNSCGHHPSRDRHVSTYAL